MQAPSLRNTTLFLLAFLAVATVCLWILRWNRPRTRVSPYVRRLRVWWTIAFFLIVAHFVDKKVSLTLLAALSFWALKEYVTQLRTRPADHKVLVWTFLAVPLQYLWIGFELEALFFVFIPVWMFLFLPVRMAITNPAGGFLQSVSQSHWGLMAFVFGLSHLGAILLLDSQSDLIPSGLNLLVYLVILLEIADSVGSLASRFIGRTPILPHVSSEKTWEGLLVGLLASIGVGYSLRWITPFTQYGQFEVIWIAVLIVLAGTCGFIAMGALKKDFGSSASHSLPGRGGMFSRVEAFCYAAPIFFYYVRYYYGAG